MLNKMQSSICIKMTSMYKLNKQQKILFKEKEIYQNKMFWRWQNIGHFLFFLFFSHFSIFFTRSIFLFKWKKGNNHQFE